MKELIRDFKISIIAGILVGLAILLPFWIDIAFQYLIQWVWPWPMDMLVIAGMFFMEIKIIGKVFRFFSNELEDAFKG